MSRRTCMTIARRRRRMSWHDLLAVLPGPVVFWVQNSFTFQQVLLAYLVFKDHLLTQ